MSYDFLSLASHGLIDLPWWGYVVVTLVMTHVTIASVTIFLHRAQAHRALDLHPVVSHFFRFWLWLTTGMVTKEWVAIHRKHHAKVETPDDPHSPQTRGIETVFWQGHRAVSRGIEEPRNARQVRSRHAGRLDRAQRLHALRLAGRGPDAGRQPHAVRADRRHDLGGADDVDPDHRRRHHQRHRPLLGLSQFRLRGRVDQHRALGHRDRRRGAAQQSPRVRHVGQAVVAVVRVRHRLDVHPASFRR